MQINLFVYNEMPQATLNKKVGEELDKHTKYRHLDNDLVIQRLILVCL